MFRSWVLSTVGFQSHLRFPSQSHAQVEIAQADPSFFNSLFCDLLVLRFELILPFDFCFELGLLGRAWEVLDEMYVRQWEALLVWSLWPDLLFDLVASSVLLVSCVADFGCRSIDHLGFTGSNLCICSDFSFLPRFLGSIAFL
jgi:hypothetical protein